MGDVWERLLKERGYKIQHTLGEGAYSKVKSAFSSRLNREVAIKCINTQLAPTDFVEKFLPRELKTLPVLRHENIVRVYEILEYKPTVAQASDGYVYIVMEAARNGDMLRYIQRKGALPEPEIRHYFYQLVQAVSYCHSQNICHRDLKCENLLLDKDFKLLLTDFGFSKSMSYDPNGRITLSNTFCGSAAYAAPEIIQGQSYDPRMHDMWSMGVILYIMSCGHMPFDDSNVKKMLRVQLRNHLKFPPRVQHLLSEELKSLIRLLIEPNVQLRANIDMVKRHPFLSGESGKTSRPNSSSSVAKQIVDFFTGGQPHQGGGGSGSPHQGPSSASNQTDRRRNTITQVENTAGPQTSSQGHRRHHHRSNRPPPEDNNRDTNSRLNQAPRHSCGAYSPPDYTKTDYYDDQYNQVRRQRRSHVKRSRSKVELAEDRHSNEADDKLGGSKCQSYREWLSQYYNDKPRSGGAGTSSDDHRNESNPSTRWKTTTKRSSRSTHRPVIKKRIKKKYN